MKRFIPAVLGLIACTAPQAKTGEIGGPQPDLGNPQQASPDLGNPQPDTVSSGCPLTQDAWRALREVSESVVQDALAASEPADPTTTFQRLDAALTLPIAGGAADNEFFAMRGTPCAPQQSGCDSEEIGTTTVFYCAALSCESDAVFLSTEWFSSSSAVDPGAAQTFSISSNGVTVSYQVPPIITWRYDWSTPGLTVVDARPMQSATFENQGQVTDFSFAGTTHVETSSTASGPVTLSIQLDFPALGPGGVSLDVGLDPLNNPRGTATVSGQPIASFTSDAWDGACVAKWGAK